MLRSAQSYPQDKSVGLDQLRGCHYWNGCHYCVETYGHTVTNGHTVIFEKMTKKKGYRSSPDSLS
jgi:hypothetical protein